MYCDIVKLNSRIKLDSFSGECDCIDGFLPWPNDPLCYPEFSQGPCPESHQLIADENEEPVCRISNCPDTFIRWKNGACVQPVDCQEGKENQVLGKSDFD